MKKILFVTALVLSVFSCSRSCRVAKITHGEDEKLVEVCWGDSTLADTTFTVESTVPNSVILNQLRNIEDSLKQTRDKLVLDSLYKKFQQDSIHFRQITKKINGGYNGWEYRYKLWLNAREILKQYNNNPTE